MELKFDEKSCGLVLFREEEGEKQFLLLQYPQGHWDFVKGHIEPDEDEHETAFRELEEETGITDAQIFDDFRTEMSYIYERDGQPSNKQVVYFLARTAQGKIDLSHEHLDFIWLPTDEAFAKLTYDNARVVLQKALDFLR